MKTLTYLTHILGCIAVAVSAISASADTVVETNPGVPERGEGDEYYFNMGPFDVLQLQDNVDVVYRCVPDSAGMVTWHGHEDFANAFIISNNGNTLKIQVNTEDLGRPDMPTLYIYSSFLTKVLNYSDSSITAESLAPVPRLEFSQVGNGRISAQGISATDVVAKVTAGMGTIALSGRADRALYRMTGNGTIQADNLESKQVKIKIFGAGTIGCWPVEALISRGIGSTKIYYKGKPEISHKGGGKLIEIE